MESRQFQQSQELWLSRRQTEEDARSAAAESKVAGVFDLLKILMDDQAAATRERQALEVARAAESARFMAELRSLRQGPQEGCVPPQAQNMPVEGEGVDTPAGTSQVPGQPILRLRGAGRDSLKRPRPDDTPDRGPPSPLFQEMMAAFLRAHNDPYGDVLAWRGTELSVPEARAVGDSWIRTPMSMGNTDSFRTLLPRLATATLIPRDLEEEAQTFWDTLRRGDMSQTSRSLRSLRRSLIVADESINEPPSVSSPRPNPPVVPVRHRDRFGDMDWADSARQQLAAGGWSPTEPELLTGAEGCYVQATIWPEPDWGQATRLQLGVEPLVRTCLLHDTALLP